MYSSVSTMKPRAAAAAAAAASSSSSSSSRSPEKKAIGGKGKKKIPIAKITGDRARMVTFSKRRNGLFKKAAELSTLCGVRVAVLAFSQAGKPFVYGAVESLANPITIAEENQSTSSSVADTTITIEEEEEENLSSSSSAATAASEWWRDLCIEGMGLEELEALHDRLIMEKTMLETCNAQEWADSLMNL